MKRIKVNRWKLAWHVFWGKPLIYKMNMLEVPRLYGDDKHSWMVNCFIDPEGRKK